MKQNRKPFTLISHIDNPELYEKLIKIPDKYEKEICNFLKCQIEKLDRKKTFLILSIGVGNGRIEVPLSKKLIENGINFKVVGVDINEKQLNLLQKKIKKNNEGTDSNFDLYKSESGFLKEKFVPGNYDVITFFNVVNQFSRENQFGWKDALNKAIELLKEGGLLILNDEIGTFACLDGNFAFTKIKKTQINFIKLCYGFARAMRVKGLNRNLHSQSTDSEVVLNWLEYDKKEFLKKKFEQSWEWTKNELNLEEIFQSYIMWLKDTALNDLFTKENLENELTSNDKNKCEFTQGLRIYGFIKAKVKHQTNKTLLRN